MIFLSYLCDGFPLFHGLFTYLIGHLLHEKHRPVDLIDILATDLCLQLQLILDGFYAQGV
jgi:hypothetical protein